MKVTRETTLGELTQYPEAVKLMFGVGLHCAGCFAAQFETVEQGAKAHGMTDEQVDRLIEKLNEITQKKRK